MFIAGGGTFLPWILEADGQDNVVYRMVVGVEGGGWGNPAWVTYFVFEIIFCEIIWGGGLKWVVRFGAVSEGDREETGLRQLKAVLVKAPWLWKSLKLSWYHSEEQCHLLRLHLPSTFRGYPGCNRTVDPWTVQVLGVLTLCGWKSRWDVMTLDLSVPCY